VFENHTVIASKLVHNIQFLQLQRGGQPLISVLQYNCPAYPIWPPMAHYV
jgi:hypothetical protein